MTFITFEGTEGSGKSTQVALLAVALRSWGVDPVVTREPGGTPIGDRLRGLLLDIDVRPDPVTEAYLMTAARAEHVRRVIRPALDAGRVVVCDRYVDSTLAYQGGGRGLSVDALCKIQELATEGLIPTLTILLDVPVDVGLARRERGGDANRFDQESLAFHERVAAWYRSAAKAEPGRWRRIDATPPPDVVHTQVVEAVRQVTGLGLERGPERSAR